MKRNNISIIIATYDRTEVLLRTLTSLLQLHEQFLEIIVIDQTPGAALKVDTHLSAWKSMNITVIRLSEPAVCLARNIGAAVAQGSVLLYVDDDVEIIEPMFITAHLAHYANPEIHAVQGRIKRPDGSDQVHVPLQDAFASVHPGTFVTANVSVRRDALLAVEGFDEGFSGRTYANEDGDLGRRLCLAGYHIVYDPSAVLVHLKAAAGGNRLTRQDRAPEWTKSVTFFQLALRHFNGLRRAVEIMRVVRVITLRKENVLSAWRVPGALWHATRGFCEAVRRHKAGFRSSLQGTGYADLRHRYGRGGA